MKPVLALLPMLSALLSGGCAQPPGDPAIITVALYAAPMFGFGAGALWQRLQMPSFVVVDTETKRGLRVVDEVE